MKRRTITRRRLSDLEAKGGRIVEHIWQGGRHYVNYVTPQGRPRTREVVA